MSASPIAGAAVTWLHRLSLDDTLTTIAEHGLSHVELTSSRPHLQATALDAFERSRLRRRLRELGLSALSVNPTGLDLNPVSMHSDFRDLTRRLLVEEVHLAADLGARFVVVSTGRVHGLAPVPTADAVEVLVESYSHLAEAAGRAGVVVAVESVPYGFVRSSAELAAVVAAIGSPHAKLLYDVSNLFAREDIAAGLESVREHLGLVHVSDTRRDRWMHASPGRGEVDFSYVHAALERIGYSEPTVYELLDPEHDPSEGYADDLRRLETAGWSR
ncbi:sugar phosphate isomerase/epimerase family protein [Microbacterium sp. E-13]|uniref:sugar phosphate isomerase/epimerase family protein n=1 Tax=Microbacterium sp. E-13 TaxID=3404048 RepID=UPI003CFB7D30